MSGGGVDARAYSHPDGGTCGVAIEESIRVKSRMTSRPFLIPSVLILIASIPLVLSVVPRNRFYGIRTCKTMSDDGIWYSANRFGGWALIAASLFSLMVSGLVPYDNPANFCVWTVHFCGFLLPLAVGIIATLLYVKKR